MLREKNFGIGCYHFGIRKNSPFVFKGSEYLTELEKSLSNIANLDKLSIDFQTDFKNEIEQINETVPNLEEEGGFFPCPSYLDIEFDLYIPFRIQAELSFTEEKFLQTFSEKFRIKIFQSFYFPVAIIETLNPSTENDPSKAIQIVREFLRKELTSEKSPYIRFECIGPSPFHLDCFIKPKEQDENEYWLIDLEQTIERGYDKAIFYYNTKAIADAEEALEYLRNSIEDEFGFYYKNIQLRNERMHSWERIENSLGSLQRIQAMKGVRGFLNRLLEGPSMVGKLFTDIATFEASDIYSKSILQNQYNEIYKAKDDLFFKDFIGKELEEKHDYPVKQITELVKFYEGRRVKSVELIIAIIAAILGGAVGALLTIYFRSGQSLPVVIGH